MSSRTSRPFSRSGWSVAVAAGIPEDRVLLDPGLGFGKTPDQNLELVRGLARIVAIGRPVLVGISRKSTLGRVLGDPDARTGTVAASVGAAVAAFDRGATVFRVHDVLPHVEALAVAAAVERGSDRMTIELNGIVLHGYHGVLEHERRDGQRFLVDVELDLEHEQAARTDRIEDAVDYRRVVERVRAVSDGRAHNLLESFAAVLADTLLEEFPVDAVRVRVRKPDVVLDPPVTYAAVRVERRRGGSVAATRCGSCTSPPGCPSRGSRRGTRTCRGRRYGT